MELLEQQCSSAHPGKQAVSVLPELLVPPTHSSGQAAISAVRSVAFLQCRTATSFNRNLPTDGSLLLLLLSLNISAFCPIFLHHLCVVDFIFQVAKSVSAYDMTVSDSMYGACHR